jgi:hypothetical protein
MMMDIIFGASLAFFVLVHLKTKALLIGIMAVFEVVDL